MAVRRPVRLPRYRGRGALLRELGRRLPGLAAASPSYLWHNVLDVDARVELEDDRAWSSSAMRHWGCCCR